MTDLPKDHLVPERAPAGAELRDTGPLYWQSPDGHWSGVRVRREFEVSVIDAEGGETATNCGANYALALQLAEAPTLAVEPGAPGAIRYRDVITVTGSWTLVTPLDTGPPPSDG